MGRLAHWLLKLVTWCRQLSSANKCGKFINFIFPFFLYFERLHINSTFPSTYNSTPQLQHINLILIDSTQWAKPPSLAFNMHVGMGEGRNGEHNSLDGSHLNVYTQKYIEYLYAKWYTNSFYSHTNVQLLYMYQPQFPILVLCESDRLSRISVI